MTLVGQIITPSIDLQLKAGQRAIEDLHNLKRQRKGESNKVKNLLDELRKKQKYINELELEITKIKSQTNGKQIVMSLKNVG